MHFAPPPPPPQYKLPQIHGSQPSHTQAGANTASEEHMRTILPLTTEYLLDSTDAVY